MDRALLLIGVAKCGLEELPAVCDGIDAFKRWAATQGYSEGENLVVLSDVTDPVTSSAVQEAVRKLLQPLTLRQLMVYFCGHGIHDDGSDIWLLSGAPANSSEAVNVAKSMRLAKRGRVPYVTFVADACRSAATTVQFDEVEGVSIFPNPVAANRSNDLDFFAACRIEDVATQVAQPDEPDTFEAVYSRVFAEALEGDYTELLDPIMDEEGEGGVVRPHRLEEWLPGLVAMRLDELGKGNSVSQVPAADVTQGADRWLSRIPIGPKLPDMPRRGGDGEADDSLKKLPVLEDPARAAAASAEEALRNTPDVPTVTAPAALRVVGDEVVGVFSANSRVAFHSNMIEVWLHNGRQTSSVLVRLSDDRCAVVPAYRGRMAALIMENHLLIDVQYLKLQGSEGAQLSQDQQDTSSLSDLRRRVAAETRYGLSWQEEIAPRYILEKYQEAVIQDPALAVYLAYGLDDQGRSDLLEILATNSEPVPYDVALLAENLSAPHVPSFPLLSRGWGLLGTDGIAAKPDLPHRAASPWTLFTSGFDQIQDYLTDEGEL